VSQIRCADGLVGRPVGRSLQDLVSFLEEIHANGVDLYMHVQGVDTTTRAGRALFQMLGVFAAFERSIIQERIDAGLARARTKGVRLGRPPAVERLAQRQIIAARAANPQKSTRAIAGELGVSERHVRRVLARDGPERACGDEARRLAVASVLYGPARDAPARLASSRHGYR
jgi:DNA invertase Pin-like site-specific DNA recombinase